MLSVLLVTSASLFAAPASAATADGVSPPIRVNGDAQFALVPGITGSGTPTDPFVIEHRYFAVPERSVATGFTLPDAISPILLENTTAWVVIRDNTFFPEGAHVTSPLPVRPDTVSAIVLRSARNVSVASNLFDRVGGCASAALVGGTYTDPVSKVNAAPSSASITSNIFRASPGALIQWSNGPIEFRNNSVEAHADPICTEVNIITPDGEITGNDLASAVVMLGGTGTVSGNRLGSLDLSGSLRFTHNVVKSQRCGILEGIDLHVDANTFECPDGIFVRPGDGSPEGDIRAGTHIGPANTLNGGEMVQVQSVQSAEVDESGRDIAWFQALGVEDLTLRNVTIRPNGIHWTDITASHVHAFHSSLGDVFASALSTANGSASVDLHDSSVGRFSTWSYATLLFENVDASDLSLNMGRDATLIGVHAVAAGFNGRTLDVQDSSFVGSDAYGLDARAARVRIENSTFAGNARAGLNLCAQFSTISDSSFVSNRDAALSMCSPSGPAIAQNDWWGDATGPDYPGVHSGLGGRILAPPGQVVVSPWLTAPPTGRTSGPDDAGSGADIPAGAYYPLSPGEYSGTLDPSAGDPSDGFAIESANGSCASGYYHIELSGTNVAMVTSNAARVAAPVAAHASSCPQFTLAPIDAAQPSAYVVTVADEPASGTPAFGDASFREPGTIDGVLDVADNDIIDAYQIGRVARGAHACPAGAFSAALEGSGTRLLLSGEKAFSFDAPASAAWTPNGTCPAFGVIAADPNATTALAYRVVTSAPTMPALPFFNVTNVSVSGATLTTPAGTIESPWRRTVTVTVQNTEDVPGDQRLVVNTTSSMPPSGARQLIANLTLHLDAHEQRTLTFDWNVAGDVGHFAVWATPVPQGILANVPQGSANVAQTIVLMNTPPLSTGQALPLEGLPWGDGLLHPCVGTGCPGLVSCEGNTACESLRSEFATIRTMVPNETRDTGDSLLDDIDALCGNGLFKVVDTSSGAAPHFCDDYNTAHGGFYVPVLGVRLCDTGQPSLVFRTLSQVLTNEPPCSPTLNATAHQTWHTVAPIVDPLVGSILVGTLDAVADTVTG